MGSLGRMAGIFLFLFFLLRLFITPKYLPCISKKRPFLSSCCFLVWTVWYPPVLLPLQTRERLCYLWLFSPYMLVTARWSKFSLAGLSVHRTFPPEFASVTPSCNKRRSFLFVWGCKILGCSFSFVLLTCPLSRYFLRSGCVDWSVGCFMICTTENFFLFPALAFVGSGRIENELKLSCAALCRNMYLTVSYCFFLSILALLVVRLFTGWDLRGYMVRGAFGVRMVLDVRMVVSVKHDIACFRSRMKWCSFLPLLFLS